MAEVGALAAAMPDHLRVVVLLASWCQLRRGEILALRRRDIDLLHGTLSIVPTRTPTMAGDMLVKAPKTEAGRRKVTIPSNVVPALGSHRPLRRVRSGLARRGEPEGRSGHAPGARSGVV